MAPGNEDADPIEVRLVRPIDLVDLTCTVRGARLERTADGPVLAVDGDDALLTVTWPYQHLGEHAWPDYEGSPPPSGVSAAVAAGPTRLVYELPAGLRVRYSLPGLLAVLPTLRLQVAASATPGPDRYADDTVTAGIGEAVFGAGLDAALTATGLTGAAGRLLLTAQALRHVSPRATPWSERLGAIGPALTVDLPPRLRPRPRRAAPRAPRAEETAIEAPYRLIVSPSRLGAFVHAPEPVAAPSAEPSADEVRVDRVELWHSELGVRVEARDGAPERITTGEHVQKVVRAVWARDLDPNTPADILGQSLAPADRRAIVRQTSQGVAGVDPLPLRVRSLALSSQGAWIDWSGSWDAKPYFDATEPGTQPDAIDSYRHLAAMGRDGFVRVTRPGFMFCLGHRSAYVTITERRIDDTPTAYLHQYHRIELREAHRAYPGRDFPFPEVTISPLVTPNLDPPPALPPPAKAGEPAAIRLPFFPTRGGEPFCWDLTVVDRAGAVHHFRAPLLFVPESALHGSPAFPKVTASQIRDAYKDHNRLGGGGQTISMAPSATPGDTAIEVASLELDGFVDTDAATSRPFLAQVTGVVPAMRHLAPQAPARAMTYAKAFLDTDGGFGPGNPGQVFLRLTGDALADFGTGTDRAGGFLAPNLSVAGLSRTLGAVGDAGDDPGRGLGAGRFSATDFLGKALPKLFGLFSLAELVPADAALDAAPSFVTEALDTVSGIAAEGERLGAAITDARKRLADEIGHAAHAGAAAALEQARESLEVRATTMLDHLTALGQALGGVFDDPAAVDDLHDAATAVRSDLTDLQAVLNAPALPALVRASLDVPARALGALLAGVDIVQAVKTLLAGGLVPGAGTTARYTWTTTLHSWPQDAPVFDATDSELTLAVSVRTATQGAPVVDVTAELRHFALQLLPGTQLMRLRFGRLGFRGGSTRKPEVDVVFDGLEFLGPLSFIDALRRMIPFDGFADPPHVDVSPAGVTAGFDLALPNVSVGVFSLENIALRADARIPFLGDAVTVGFAFCAKDSPFRMTVLCVGGGGWVTLRASAMGLVELEMGLEAAAALSVDLGVASGSVSVAVGVYLRLEGKQGSLTAYFRIRGEVNVLGLVSACITLELSLTYELGTGELVGRATLVVDIEVLFFSASVEITCERRLAGSSADPTLADIMPPDAAGPDLWAQYCGAFTSKGA